MSRELGCLMLYAVTLSMLLGFLWSVFSTDSALTLLLR